MTKLKKYLVDNNISNQELGDKIGLSSAYVSQLATGHRTAGLCIAIRIEDATGHKVTCRDMAESSKKNKANV